MPSSGFELAFAVVALPELSDFEVSTWEYELMGLSAAGQFLRHYRPMLAKLGAMTTAQVKQQPAGRRVRVAGMAVVKPDKVQQFKAVLRENLLVVDGVVQRSGEAVSVLVSDVRSICFSSFG